MKEQEKVKKRQVFEPVWTFHQNPRAPLQIYAVSVSSWSKIHQTFGKRGPTAGCSFPLRQSSYFSSQ